MIHYNPEKDNYQLKAVENNVFQTFIMSHVLEHLQNPEQILKALFNACRGIGIKKIIIVVPGEKGFRFDKTHKTFIDKAFLLKNNLIDLEGYSLTSNTYFPINLRWIEKCFTYQELQLIYEIVI